MTKSAPQRQAGSTLVVIIIAIVVVAVLGVGMYTLTSTGQLNQARAQNDAKAYYISESCIRIAASEYKAADANLKNSKLVALNNKSFTMPENQGSCTVQVYPYWFYANTPSTAGSTSIELYFPGAVPPADQDSNNAINIPNNVEGRLKNANGEVYEFTNTNIESNFTQNAGTKATFTLNAPLGANSIQAGNELFLGFEFSSAVILDGNLVITLPDNALSEIFPPERGIIFLDESCDGSNPIIYSYNRRTEPEQGKVALTNLAYLGSCSPEPNPFSAGGEIIIYIGKNIGFRSTANFGN